MQRRRYLLLTAGGLTAVSGCSTSDYNSPVESTDDVEVTIRSVVNKMDAGEFPRVYELFSENKKDRISIGKIEQFWLGYLSGGGDYEEILDISEVEREQESDIRSVDVSLRFERGTHVIRIFMKLSNNSILGLTIGDEYRKPDYVDTTLFNTKRTVIDAGDCSLKAAVTAPKEVDSVPGVVIVQGSDRDGSANIFDGDRGAKPLKDLAEGLSSHGIAVLRYEKRTSGCPNSIRPEEYTLDKTTVTDALFAINKLRNHPEVNPDNIFVAGHSLGGMMAPRIAQMDGKLAGIIMLAAPARHLYKVFMDQFEHIMNVGEFQRKSVEKSFNQSQGKFDRIRSESYRDDTVILDYPGSFWKSINKYDQINSLDSVDAPALILQGDRDYLVPPEEDFNKWQSEFRRKSNVSLRLFEGLDHNFQYGEGPSVSSEHGLANPVDSQVIDEISNWILSD